MKKPVIAALALALSAGLVSSGALARDAAFDQARSAGQVGEMLTGYIGIVGQSTPDLERVVRNINSERKQIYATKAPSKNVTIEKYGQLTACIVIGKMEPGIKYQGMDGGWLTRTTGDAQLPDYCKLALSII